MIVTSKEPSWSTLPNPFQVTDISDIITGHISGRSTDIMKILNGGQSALILAGVPYIGKSALISYLACPPQLEWTWRKEISASNISLNLNETFFVQVSLTPTEDIKSKEALLSFFIKQCLLALQPLHAQNLQLPPSEPKELRKIIQEICQQNSKGRFFLTFDTIERLESLGTSLFDLLHIRSSAETAQERSLALLDNCGALHMLINLISEFNNFAVILSLESLPRPTINDQFTHISADLARFTTMTLQTFTWQDTIDFLRQEPENFGGTWADAFNKLGGEYIFSHDEQIWLRMQAGTHPYLLQQFCYRAFHFKQESAVIRARWTDLQEIDKKLLIEEMQTRLSTFLKQVWRRLQKALERSSQDVKSSFYQFVISLAQKQGDDEIDDKVWNQLPADLRYILNNEGIIRYDRLQAIHIPGKVLREFLIQKAVDNKAIFAPAQAIPISFPTRGYWVTISRPGSQRERLALSELEHHLLKTLMQNPQRCTQEELMESAWGKPIERPTFTQRMYHLRKKLKEKSGDTEIIENRYGGQYSLNYVEWLHLE